MVIGKTNAGRAQEMKIGLPLPAPDTTHNAAGDTLKADGHRNSARPQPDDGQDPQQEQ